MDYRHLPPLNALKAFDAVARHGSFSKAAVALDVSQGAVSRHIVNLEGVLGCSLFERGKSGASLTVAGRTYQAQITPALESILTATTTFKTGHADSRLLRISASSSFALRWLTPRLADFQAACPSVAADLTVSDTVPDLLSGACDVAVVPHLIKDAPKGWAHLFDEILVPVCHPDYAQHHGLTNASDVMGCTLIRTTSRPDIWERWAQAVCPEAIFADRGGPGLQDFYLSIEAALSGSGVALVPEFLVADDIAAGRLLVPAGGAFRSGHAYWLVTRTDQRAGTPVGAFARWLRNGLEQV